MTQVSSGALQRDVENGVAQAIVRSPGRIEELRMITLRNKDTGEVLGTISESELQVLVDALEEESRDDTDYYINEETIDLLGERGASASLLALLRRALGSREGVDVQWIRS